MKIDYKQAREFLEKINEKDNVVIFTHTDLDGFASGNLFLNYLNQQNAKSEVKIINYGVNRISDTDTNKFNKVLISDLAPGMIWEDLSKLAGKEVFYTDHHQADAKCPIPEFIHELRTTDQGYIPSTRTVYELTEKENKSKLWIATIGVLSDMAEKYPENNEFLQKAYWDLGLDQESLMKYLFKLNFALIGNPSLEDSFTEISKMNGLEDVVKLAKYYEPVEKEMGRIRKDYLKKREATGKIVYYCLETIYPGLKSAFINVVSGEEKDNVLVFSNIKNQDIISMSARNQSKEYDVSQILKDCVLGFKDGFAGGHKSASGAQMHKYDLERFKERLIQVNLEKYKI